MAETVCLQRLVDSAAPKRERSPKRALSIQRDMVVGKRERGALYLPTILAEQPGGETDKARFTTAVAAADLECVARLQVKAQVFEQQAAAAAQADVAKAEQGAQGTLASSAWMSSSL